MSDVTLDEYRAQARAWLEANLERRAQGESGGMNPWDGGDDSVEYFAAQRALQKKVYEAGYAGIGHPEHHLQIEGFEASNEPGLLSMWMGQHSKRLRVNMVGFVAPTHNPVRTAEYIATLDHMLRGRLGVGMVRGYQARWVHNFRIRQDLNAVGDWNRNSEDDDINREYFKEFVDIILTAWKKDTFSYQGKYFTIPPKDMVNPHAQPVYTKYGKGVDTDMRIREIGIAPKPLQTPHPPLYGGFTHSMRTALFWAQYAGKPIVLASDLIDNPVSVPWWRGRPLRITQ